MGRLQPGDEEAADQSAYCSGADPSDGGRVGPGPPEDEGYHTVVSATIDPTDSRFRPRRSPSSCRARRCRRWPSAWRSARDWCRERTAVRRGSRRRSRRAPGRGVVRRIRDRSWLHLRVPAPVASSISPCSVSSSIRHAVCRAGRDASPRCDRRTSRRSSGR